MLPSVEFCILLLLLCICFHAVVPPVLLHTLSHTADCHCPPSNAT